ncbi:MAG: ABC transporter ATP-binding protein [Bacteroidota bacterium]
MNQLTTQNLSIGYRNNDPIQRDLNLKLETRSLVALLGLNGKGKSTLLRTLAGLQAPLSGEIFWGDKNLQSISPRHRAYYLSLVLTDPIENNHLSVQELVATGRFPHTNWWGKLNAIDKHKIQEALELTQTQDWKKRRFASLSDGEKQRVLLARAIAQDTPLVFLDEPTAHLDTYHQKKLFELLRELIECKKCTVLIATHAVHLANESADLLWILKETPYYGKPNKTLIEQVFF